jgi:hypothetical protein
MLIADRRGRFRCSFNVAHQGDPNPDEPCRLGTKLWNVISMIGFAVLPRAMLPLVTYTSADL